MSGMLILSKSIMKKQMKNQIDKNRLLYLILPISILIIFIIFGLLLLPAYQYKINPDATGYIQIAHLYAQGQILHAVNGYWSPLLSWLLVPFSWLNIDLLIGARILALMSSVCVLTIAWVNMRRQKMPWQVLVSLLFILSIMLLDWSLAGAITGDLLFLLIAMIIPLITIRFINDPTLTNILILGASGAGLYFAKAIGFYIFICYLAVIFVAAKKYDYKSFKKYLLVLVCFAVIVGPYIAAISYKNRQPTISTASSYNIELAKRFDYQSKLYPHPTASENLFPLKPYQLFVNENPDSMRDTLIANSPVSKKQALENYLGSFINNIQILALYPLFILAIIGITFMFYRDKEKYDRTNVLLATIGLITLIGTIASIVELRYLYILVVGAIIGIGVMLNKSKKNINTYACCLVLLLLTIPSINNLVQNAYVDDHFYIQSMHINELIPPGSNVLSDNSDSLYYCYYGQFRCLGNITINESNQKQIYIYIRDNNIKYYIISDRDTLANKYFVDLVNKSNIKPIPAFQ